MYQSRRTILGLSASGNDECFQKMEGVGGTQRAKSGADPAAADVAPGVLAGAMAYGIDRELSAALKRLSTAVAELPPGGAAREHILAAMQAAERAGELNRQLLARAGEDRAQARPMDLNALIREKVQLLELERSSDLTLRLQLAQALPAVEGDPGVVQEAVGHLLTNAVEAIGSKPGIVTVVTETMVMRDSAFVAAGEGDEYLTVDEALTPGHYVTLQVCDDGCGMDEETRKRMFAPFFSTKGVGRGLGMTAVLGAMRGHGGGLEVTSRPGQGTTVTLYFPTAGDSSDLDWSASQQTKTAGDNGAGRHCVLVIDDELDVREAVTDILEIKGLDVLTAADGKSGLELYRQNHDVVDLVLLDLSMPKMGGEETYRRLCSFDRDVCVLITSGYDQGDTDASLRRLGPAGFLPKPYDMDKLVGAVFELLEEKGSAGTS